MQSQAQKSRGKMINLRLNEKVMKINLIFGLVEKISLYKMSYIVMKNRVKVELDLLIMQQNFI